jgi:hypothetical protein
MAIIMDDFESGLGVLILFSCYWCGAFNFRAAGVF